MFFHAAHTCGGTVAAGMEIDKSWHVDSQILITTANSAYESSLVHDCSQQQINVGSIFITRKMQNDLKHFSNDDGELCFCFCQLILMAVDNITSESFN